MNQIVLCFLNFFTLTLVTPSISAAQQQYSANSIQDCNNSDENGPSPAFLYTCNGQYSSCQTFLIFKSQPPYNSVPSISMLLSSNPSELARINNVSRLAVFPTGKEVIVPGYCSCSGQYYQVNASFVIPTIHDTYYTSANNTYQGLTTCDSLKRANPYNELGLKPGLELRVPLRCACPTRNQTAGGVNYLMTYSVAWGDSVPDVSERFNVSTKMTLEANGFLEEDPKIYPFTTILIPLQTQPSSSQTIIQSYSHDISPSYTPSPCQKRPRRALFVGVAVAASCSLLLLTVVLISIFLFYKKKKIEGVLRNQGKTKTTQVLPTDLLVEIASFDKVLKVFEFEDIKRATDNFSSRSRIKGSVFRGAFKGQVLAVKVMNKDVSKEVSILSRINHFNLIKLEGVCENHGSFFLVFEYMKNGSLREWLLNNTSRGSQTWAHRIEIALDIANGLHYLHNFTKPAYVHKDIKSSNVLLNSDLRAKIANFRLASTKEGESNSEVLTTNVVGTRGYMAPEYIERGSVTPKIDVYAFGVVMLELITGKDAIIIHGREVLLSAAVTSIMERENAETELSCFIENHLGEQDGTEFAVQMAKLCVACLTRDPAGRPGIDEVVSSLSKIQSDVQKSRLSYVE